MEKTILLNILNSKAHHLDLIELDKSGILDSLLPELTALKQTDKGHKNNFTHTLKVVEQTKEASNDPIMVLVAMLHDIGKAVTKRFIPNIGWTFHNHEQVGADMLKAIFTRFDLDTKDFDRVYNLVKWHGHIKNLTEDSADASIRRFDKEIGKYLEDIIIFSKCDITTRFDDKRQKYCAAVDFIYKRILEIRAEDTIREYQIPVTGQVIMKDFNIKPSKLLGDIKTAAKDAVISGKIKGDYDSVYSYIKDFIKEKTTI